jgi:DNA-binding transcriptional MerR regulator
MIARMSVAVLVSRRRIARRRHSTMRRTAENIMTATDTETQLDTQSSNSFLTISEVAKRYNLTLRALRFYEARGFVTPHRQGVKRLYDAEAIRRLKLVLRGKSLGFTLTEIAAMMRNAPEAEVETPDLTLEPGKLLAQIQLLQQQRSMLDQAILELEQTRDRMAMADGQDQAPPMRQIGGLRRF